jgi:dehydrogenase/reductase SDR family member 4
MNRFKDQVCLVTASTQGIGLAIADRLGSEGGFVHICSRNEKNVNDAVASLKSKGI